MYAYINNPPNIIGSYIIHRECILDFNIKKKI